MLWSDHLNMSFNTTIFTQNHNYIYELGNIYAAKATIESALNQVVPNIKHQMLDNSVSQLIDAIDDLKLSTKKCVDEMEEQRRSMYKAAKIMIMLRDGIKQQHDGRGSSYGASHGGEQSSSLQKAIERARVSSHKI